MTLTEKRAAVAEGIANLERTAQDINELDDADPSGLAYRRLRQISPQVMRAELALLREYERDLKGVEDIARGLQYVRSGLAGMLEAAEEHSHAIIEARPAAVCAHDSNMEAPCVKALDNFTTAFESITSGLRDILQALETVSSKEN